MTPGVIRPHCLKTVVLPLATGVGSAPPASLGTSRRARNFDARIVGFDAEGPQEAPDGSVAHPERRPTGLG